MKRAQTTSRLLIADKGSLFCRGLQALWGREKDLKVVGMASTADDTLAKVCSLVPDVLVINLEILRSNKLVFGNVLRQVMANRAIFVLAEGASEESLADAVAAGAKGYMLKNSSPAELTQGVRQVAFASNGNSLQISGVVPDLNALASQNGKKVQTPVLTARESEVIRLVAEGKTVREIANELSLSAKTVEAHKLNLMRKLDIHHRTGLVAYAVQHGVVPASVTC